MRVDIPVGLQLLIGTSISAVVEEDCTSGLVIEVSDNSDKVGADVVLLNVYPHNYMPNPDEGLLEVFEHRVEALLMLEIFLIDDSYAENLQCSAPSCSEACLFFSDDLLRFWLQYVQHGFA